jgi:hypothetical protein
VVSVCAGKELSQNKSWGLKKGLVSRVTSYGQPMALIPPEASPIRVDLKVMLYQSQEADNTFITSDGTSPYNSTR